MALQGQSAEVFDRLFGTRMHTEGAALQLPRKIPIRVEPKTFFANERTFLAWMHMAVVLGFVSSMITGFAVEEEETPHHKGPIGPRTAEAMQLIMLPLSIVIACYALFTFYYRSRFMQKKQVGLFDDQFGPVILGGLIFCVLLAVFVMALVDIFF